MRRPVREYLEPPELLSVVWRLTHGDRVASAELWQHPLGYELRIMASAELMRSQVHTTRQGAEADAAATKERLLGYGFVGVNYDEGGA